MVLAKEVLCEYRSRYALSSLLMFSLVTISSISMTVGMTAVSNELASVLLWMIIFFCAMAGLSRTFMQEQECGTLFTLRMYLPSKAVILGKMLFNVSLLVSVTCIVTPLFIVFMNIDVWFWEIFSLVLLLGDIGIAAVSTLTAAMVAGAQGKHSLFTVITFPVLLPQFLSVIYATSQILWGTLPSSSEIMIMTAYDAAIIAVSYILFDYLWYQ